MTDFFFLVFLCIQIVGGLIVGITSFGGNLFAVPMMTLIMGARDAILLGCVTFLSLIVLISVFYWKHLLWREIIILSIAGMIGAPFGAWLLVHASLRFLLLSAGLTIVLFLAWQFVMPRLTRRNLPIPEWVAWPCGILAGVMSGTVAMGGPPVAFYAYMRHWSKENTLGSVSAAFALQIVVIIITQSAKGLYDWELVKLCFWGCAASCIGLFMSLPLVRHINIVVFRRLVLFMLALSAGVLLVKGFIA